MKFKTKLTIFFVSDCSICMVSVFNDSFWIIYCTQHKDSSFLRNICSKLFSSNQTSSSTTVIIAFIIHLLLLFSMLHKIKTIIAIKQQNISQKHYYIKITFIVSKVSISPKTCGKCDLMLLVIIFQAVLLIHVMFIVYVQTFLKSPVWNHSLCVITV